MNTPATQPQTQTVPQSKGMTKTEFEQLLEKDVKTSVWIEPYGAQPGEEIKLSVPLIRRYIAVAAYDRESRQEIPPSDEECVKFLMLCNAHRLNPFEGDAYMIPFFDKSRGRHAWSLITAHSAFLKRAELHPFYDGMDSGIIVQRGDQIVDLPGDFRLDTDKLLGGWSIVHNKNHSRPSVKRVKLTTYAKNCGVWLNDPEGMICKVAEAQNVRDSFPTLVGGMYLREEMESDDFSRLVNQEVKKPALPDLQTAAIAAITQPEPKKESKTRKDAKGRPTLVEEPLDPPQAPAQTPNEQAQQTTPVADSQAASPPQQPASDSKPEPPETELLALAKAAGYTPEQFDRYLKADKWLKDNQTKVQDIATARIQNIVDHWTKNPAGMIERIKKVLEKAKSKE